MKKNVFFEVLVILLVFGFISCGGENDQKIYTVTIGTFVNANGSTITASPTSGVEGTEITLTITANNNYHLKSGTLKYDTTNINETTLKFNLPDKNVIITAEFKYFFIGEWIDNYNENVLIIFENGVFAIYEDIPPKYIGYYAKGIWVPQENDTIKLTRTHYTGGNYSSIDEFKQEDELENLIESYCYIISDTKIKQIRNVLGVNHEVEYNLIK